MPIFSSASPNLDGAPATIGDGVVRLRTIALTGYPSPCWVRADGGRVYRVNSMPARLSMHCGSIEVLSTDPAAVSGAPGYPDPVNVHFNSREPGAGSADPNNLFDSDYGRKYPSGLITGQYFCNRNGSEQPWIAPDPDDPVFAPPCGVVFQGDVPSQDPYINTYSGTSGILDGIRTNTNYAEHSFRGHIHGQTPTSNQEDVWIRWLQWVDANFMYGGQKVLTFNNHQPGWGGIYWGGMGFNVGGGTSDHASIGMVNNHAIGSVVVLDQNISPFDLPANLRGHWTFLMVRMRLNTVGQTNGIWQLWGDRLGTNGIPQVAGGLAGVPTLRASYTNVDWGRAASDTLLINTIFKELWWNPPGSGEERLKYFRTRKAAFPAGQFFIDPNLLAAA